MWGADGVEAGAAGGQVTPAQGLRPAGSQAFAAGRRQPVHCRPVGGVLVLRPAMVRQDKPAPVLQPRNVVGRAAERG